MGLYKENEEEVRREEGAEQIEKGRFFVFRSGRTKRLLVLAVVMDLSLLLFFEVVLSKPMVEWTRREVVSIGWANVGDGADGSCLFFFLVRSLLQFWLSFYWRLRPLCSLLPGEGLG